MSRRPIQIAAPRGLSSDIATAPVDGAASWVRGAVVVNVSGELEEGGANPTAIAGIATYTHPPTNSYATDIGKYHPALPGVEFEASVDNNGAIDTGAIAAAQQFAAFGITQDSDGVWYVDLGKTGATVVRVRVTRLLDPVGTVNGRVRFVFLPIVDLAGTPTAVTLFAGN